jgi:SAM-dependent methyltransferase
VSVPGGLVLRLSPPARQSSAELVSLLSGEFGYSKHRDVSSAESSSDIDNACRGIQPTIRVAILGSLLACLPDLQGRVVLDLGCGIGDQTSLLCARGARVLAFDANEELLAVAQSCEIPNAEFRHCNLRGDLPPLAEPVDGVWCSFTAVRYDARGVLILPRSCGASLRRKSALCVGRESSSSVISGSKQFVR